MNFWDSSAVVPLLVEEPPAQRLRMVLKGSGRPVVWWGTSVECVSALARRGREHSLSTLDLDTAQGRLNALAEGWSEIAPSVPLRDRAMQFLRTYTLRAADALQLAAAHIASEQTGRRLDFVCLDHRLADAAEREGFSIVA